MSGYLDRINPRTGLRPGLQRKGNRIQASVSIGGVQTYIGTYDTLEEASDAADKARRKYAADKLQAAAIKYNVCKLEFPPLQQLWNPPADDNTDSTHTQVPASTSKSATSNDSHTATTQWQIVKPYKVRDRI